MNDGLEKIQKLCIDRNHSFVSFRLPRQQESTTYIQSANELSGEDSLRNSTREKAFIMAPFDTRNGYRILAVRPDLVFREDEIGEAEIRRVEELPERPAPEWNGSSPVVTGREKYMGQVNEIKKAIATGSFQKAVLSRIRVIEGAYVDIVSSLYTELCKLHPNAFVYLFKHNSHFWMGASPEPLLLLREGRLSTVSLAGTRPYAEEHMDIERWTVKEALEQQYVTSYIHDVLHSFDIRDYRVSSPYVKKAGNLLHLRTDFSLDVERVEGRLWDLVEALHPTPAVAGQPKEDAIRFIKHLEPHDREYYTGFLGPVNQDQEIDLFVNLRCLKITPAYLALYVGGGITLDSDPSDEHDETIWKAESLLNILRSFIKNLEPGHEASSTYR